MSSIWPRILLVLLSLMLISYKSVGESPFWCIANKNYPDDALQHALKLSCEEPDGANCTMIEVNQPCHYPNTIVDHASYAINSYFQRHKHHRSVCKGVGVTTDIDPSHGDCMFEYFP